MSQGPHRNEMDEESEMIEMDPREREVTPAQMNTIAESDDQDPLLRVEGNDAEGTPTSVRGDTGDPQLPHTRGEREDTAAGEAVAHDAEEDRVRPGDRKHGRE